MKNGARQRRSRLVLRKPEFLEFPRKIRRRTFFRRTEEHGRKIPQARKKSRRTHRRARNVDRRTLRVVLTPDSHDRRSRWRRRKPRRSTDFRRTSGVRAPDDAHERGERARAELRTEGSRTRRSRRKGTARHIDFPSARNGARDSRRLFEPTRIGAVGEIPVVRRRDVGVRSVRMTRETT